MFVLFDVIFTLYFILYLPILLLRGKWHKGFLVRFGFIPPEVGQGLSKTENFWVHAVSVGEVAAMEGVIDSLRAAFPSARIVLTVTTKTGHSFARRKYQDPVIVLWSPLDLSMTVDSFVRAIRPLVYIAAETELWPNLFARLYKDKIPILVLNGRISDQAFPRYCWVKGLLKATLSRVAVFAMQSDLDAERVIKLGAPREHVHVMGNVKFDNIPDTITVDPAQYGFDAGHDILLGGSTHAGEEQILIDIFLFERRLRPALRLVLAPRHPERSVEVAELITKAGLTPVFLSKREAILRPHEVLIVDSVGNLLPLYAISLVVFVGKSLTAHGGHNIIEPAMFGKPVIIGPNMQNFRDITRIFISEQAVIQVIDAKGCALAVHRLLNDPLEREALGNRAKAVIARHGGASRKAIDLVKGKLANAH